MRKVLIRLFLFILVLSFAGCGIKEKIENKAAGEISEKVIESAGGGKIDVKGETVTIKGEDGTKMTIGGTEWPKSDLAKKIPEFKKGMVSGVMDSKDNILINMEKVKKKDFTQYLEEIKKDFKSEVTETNSNEFTSYSAGNTKGIAVLLYYVSEKETFSINITQTKE